MGDDCLHSSASEKDLQVIRHYKLNLSQQHEAVVEHQMQFLDCTDRNSKTRKVEVSLFFSVLVKLQLKYYIQLWAPYFQEGYREIAGDSEGTRKKRKKKESWNASHMSKGLRSEGFFKFQEMEIRMGT